MWISISEGVVCEIWESVGVHSDTPAFPVFLQDFICLARTFFAQNTKFTEGLDFEN
jgi:hypothetical protein